MSVEIAVLGIAVAAASVGIGFGIAQLGQGDLHDVLPLVTGVGMGVGIILSADRSGPGEQEHCHRCHRQNERK